MVTKASQQTTSSAMMGAASSTIERTSTCAFVFFCVCVSACAGCGTGGGVQINGFSSTGTLAGQIAITVLSVFITSFVYYKEKQTGSQDRCRE